MDDKRSGVEVSWFDNGQPSSAGKFSEFKQHGQWQYFHKNGQISSIEIYDHDSLKNKQYFDENGNIVPNPPDPRKRKTINTEDIQIGVSKQEDLPQADVVRKGVVTFFNESKGYGFIKDQQSQESIFVHINGQVNRIKENDKVTFETEMGPKGPSAVSVTLIIPEK